MGGVDEQGTRRPIEEQEPSDLLARGAGRRRRRRLMRWCSSAHPPAYAALHSSGGADNPACHWLYDTLLFPDPDLRLAAARMAGRRRRELGEPVWQGACVTAAELETRGEAAGGRSSSSGATQPAAELKKAWTGSRWRWRWRAPAAGEQRGR